MSLVCGIGKLRERGSVGEREGMGERGRSEREGGREMGMGERGDGREMGWERETGAGCEPEDVSSEEEIDISL